MKFEANPMKAMKQPMLLVLLAAFAPLTAHAAGQAATDAGSMLRQMQPLTPPPPPAPGPKVRVQQEGRANLPVSAPFLIKTIRLSGNAIFGSAPLHSLIAEAEGKSLTLPELDALVARITDFYRDHGYPLARAFIPAQVIREGVVNVEIVEARYGKTRLANRSNVRDSLLQAIISPLQGGQYVEQTGMDRTMLLLSDIPGVVATATLKPGERVGTSDFLAEVASGPAASGQLTMDNFGDRYTGRTRAGGFVNLNNPLHAGDILSVSALSSGRGMENARLAYAFLANGQGTRVGGSLFALHYALGAGLANLDAHGEARGEDLWVKQPLLRSRDANLHVQLRYERLRLRDHIDASAIRNDRRSENWTVNLTGDARDALFSGGVNTWDAGWTAGRLSFDDATAASSDAVTANTQGRFSKWYANLARLQRVSPDTTLQLAFSGQWARANLDSSQKMSMGGPYTVRAYDMGAVSGDTGYFGSAEIRHDLGTSVGGQWQAIAFIDSAQITVNRFAWVTGASRVELRGAGVGLNWAGPDRWSARASIAAPLGSRPALAASPPSIRAWVEIAMRF
jgi:hemolysin activation/secretion protein